MSEPRDRRQRAEPRLDPPEPEFTEKRRQLTGDQTPGDQVSYRRGDEVDRLGEMTDTDVYQGELEAGVHDDLPTEPEAENVETLTDLELRAGETDDANVAAEEGLTYVPPIDPPVVPSDDRQGADVAAGFGGSALDEPYDKDHPAETLTDEDDMSARVREAIRADSATSRYADTVAIGTRGGVVALRGVVDDLEDSDNLAAVAGRVSGVAEVVDELEVRALE